MKMLLRLMSLLSVLKAVLGFEWNYPIHYAYGERLQLTKIAIILVVILGLSLLFWLILSVTIYRTTSIKLMIVFATVTFNLILYYSGTEYFCIRTMSTYFQIAPHMYFFYYLPIYIAHACFEFQASDFRGVAPYAFIISLLIMLTAMITGYVLYMITELAWSITQMFIFGLATCSCQPDPFRYSLKNPNFIKLNQLSMGEYISTMIFTMCVVYMYIDDKIDNGSTFLLLLLIEILGGMLLGLLAGCFFALTLGITKDDAKSCFVIIIMSMICVYFLAIYAAVSPQVAVFAMVPPLYMYKKHFSREANKAIREFFAMTHLVIDLVFYAYCVHIAIYVLVIEKTDNSIQISYCIFGFICTVFMRSLVYLILAPLIKRMYRALDTVAIVVNAWATITSNGAFVIGFVFYLMKSTEGFGTIILCQICFSSMCTSVINQVASEFLLRNHFASNFTTDQAANINSCLHEIRSLRVKYIYMWKMKGIVTDARWDIVKNYTNIFHTTKDNGIDQVMSFKNVTCPDCGREIQVQQPIKDVADFTKLSKKLISNQIRTILTRRHQFGTISSAAARYSVKIVEKCLTFEDHIQDALFQPFMKVGYIREKLYSWKQAVYANQNYLKRVPRKPYRARFYRFVRSSSYSYMSITLTALSVTLMILAVLTSTFTVYFYVIIGLSKLYTLVMLIQMYIFIQAYSIFSVRQGAAIYFRTTWHWLEIFTTTYSLIDCLVILILYITNNTIAWNSYKYIRLVGIVEILIAFKTVLPKIIHSVEDLLVGRITLGFEVAKAIYDAYSELELSMDFIFDDNILMASECERWVREDKQQLYKIITFVQFTYPSLARKVKTRQALDATSAVLNLMLEEVRSSGYVDMKEYEIIQKKLRSCEKQGQALGKINHHISFKEIMQNLTWIGATETVIQEYFLSTCTLRILQTGDVLCTTGDDINGVFVLLSGMLTMDYTPTNEIIGNLLKHGLLPVNKYSDSLQFFESIEQTLVTGNSLGEMSCAVHRPINVTCVALKPSKIYHIHRDNIEVAETFIRDPVDGIIAQMWKMTCFNIAIAILKSLPKYEYYTQHDLKMKLESSFMPDANNYKVFCFLDAIDDLILLQGVVKDYYSDLFFVAPCYLPRSLIKFHMHMRNPACDEAEIQEGRIEARLMIIPMPDIDKYAVMKLEDEVADLYSRTDDLEAILLDESSKLRTKENRLAGVAAIKAVTQGNHLTKFINLKK